MGNVAGEVFRAARSAWKDLGIQVRGRADQQAVLAARDEFFQDGLSLSRQAYEAARTTGLAFESDETSVQRMLSIYEAKARAANAGAHLQDLRTVAVRGGELQEVARPAGQARPRVRPQVQNQVRRADVEKAIQALSDHAPGIGAPLPEDGTLRPHTYHMFHAAGDPVSASYIQQMAEVGRAEGFRVEVTTNIGEGKDLLARLSPEQRANVDVLEQSSAGSVWIEDNQTITTGGVVVPPRLSSYSLMFQAEDREARDIQADVFGIQGSVNEYGWRNSAIATALADGRVLREARTYVESGNFITGTLADGHPYAIVGRDSVAISRRELEERMGRRVSEAETLGLMAEDYGLAPEALYVVEQPAEFHLDMRMLAVGPKEIVLNDSAQAAEVQARWWIEDYQLAQPLVPKPGASAETLKAYRHAFQLWSLDGKELRRDIVALRRNAQEATAIEARTAADLERQGFTVHRIPGVFGPARETSVVHPAVPGEMNFFNGEQGVNEAGQKFFATGGGDPRAEAYFFGRLAAETSAGYDHVHLLRRADTPLTLQEAGGLNCRVKPDGTVVFEPTSK